MSKPSVLRNEREGILELVLNRPEKLNALNQETLDTIQDALEDLRLRPELRVMLIRATGRYFCAGADLEAFQDNPDPDSALATRSWFRREMGRMQTIWQEMELLEKPIVVAHHAMCVGGGLEMSLSCDFRLAAKSAAYWFPEMKMAMVPTSGGISRLVRMVGPAWGKWMVMANKQVPAEQALAMGLVQQVFPDETFEQDVWAFCQELAALPPEVTGVAKMAVEMAADLDSANARQLERIVYSTLVLGNEHRRKKEEHYDRILKR